MDTCTERAEGRQRALPKPADLQGRDRSHVDILAEIEFEFDSTDDLDQILHKAICSLVKSAGYDRAVLLKIDKDKARWKVMSAGGGEDQDSANWSRSLEKFGCEGWLECLGGQLFSMSRPILVDHVRPSTTWDIPGAARGLIHRIGFRSVAVAPLKHLDRCLGFLVVGFVNDEKQKLTRRDIDLVTAVAERVARVSFERENFQSPKKLHRKSQMGDSQPFENGWNGHCFSMEGDKPCEMIGGSEEIRAVFEKISQVVESDVSVCIEGETGTGKELVARMIHYNSPRARHPFVVADCAALPEALLESELFGHSRGAFTGARESKKGLFEFADGGTIFLDEVGNASPALQIRLLRVLQDGEFTPLGEVKPKRVNVRVISATNVSLEDLVQQGKFRSDLFYRLYVFPIKIPPLRERKGDVPVLANCFLRRMASGLKTPISGYSNGAMQRLMSYDFPGNVRELRNEVERAITMAEDGEGLIKTEHLTHRVVRNSSTQLLPANGKGRLKEQLEQVEAHIIEEALSKQSGNVAQTARFLGLTRRGLAKKIRRLGISAAQFRRRGKSG